MCIETKKFIKSKDVVFTEDSGSQKNDLEMHPSRRNTGPLVKIVDEYSKLHLFGGGGELPVNNEHMGGNEVENEI